MKVTYALIATAIIFCSYLPLYAQKLYIGKDYRDWENYQIPEGSEIDHSVYLIGDAGLPELEPLEPNFVFLKQVLTRENPNSSIVFLGDNIYPDGMPSEDSPIRAQSEAFMNANLEMLSDFDGRVFFVPGNHDWNHYSAGGLEGIRREEEYIETYLKNKKVFYPKNGCGDPKLVKLADGLVMILIDTQWYLHKWELEPGINEGCKVKTREEFFEVLEQMVDENDDGNIIIAMHHTPFTDGQHGGYFGIIDHIFPLREINPALYIPLPIIGSFYPGMRLAGASPQDTPSEAFQLFLEKLFRATHKRKDVVYVSGHDHNLQWFHKTDKVFGIDVGIWDQDFIVSGSGSKVNFVRKGKDADFVYQGNGFSRLLYLKNGSVWMEMWAPVGDGSTGRLLFRNQLKPKTLSLSPEVQSQKLDMPDSILVPASLNYQASGFKEAFFGKQYRAVWAAPVMWPILDLSKVNGGMRPLRRGGGAQTKTLRLEDSQGKQFVLRSVDKDPGRVLPQRLKNTVVNDFAQDLISTSHPYAAMVIPLLSDAAGVYHTNPLYFYLPKQPFLGDFSEDLGGGVYLLEERPAKDRSDIGSFGNSGKIISFRSLLRKMEDSHKVTVDQTAVLRARIFDILIGDWDRHDDQWRWARFKEGITDVYRPIPRDRDQAFLTIKGIVFWAGTQKFGVRMFQDFDYKIKDVKGYGFNGRHFDRTFINGMDREHWRKMAVDMQNRMTDSVIEQAIHVWPDTVFALNGEEIIGKIKARRESMLKWTDEYYRFLAKEVEVVGTNKRERFEVTREGKDETLVRVYALKKSGREKDLIYKRRFYRKETKEIRLFGLRGDDEFVIDGKSKKGSRIRIIGGAGLDSISDLSRSGGRRTRYYDLPDGIVTSEDNRARDRTRDNPEVNEYDRQEFHYPNFVPLLVPGFNVDDGFSLAAGFMATVPGFRKTPNKEQHSFFAKYSFQTSALDFSYLGDFKNALFKESLDFHLEAKWFTPSHVQNYFGLGNGTERDESKDRDYNRIRIGEVNIFPALKKTFNLERHRFTLGPRYQSWEVQNTTGRFVSDSTSGLVDEDFEQKRYLGAEFSYQLVEVDSRILPTRGFIFSFTSLWQANIKDPSMNYGRLAADLRAYWSFDMFRNTTIASRVGGAHNIGNYEFFQANFLGRRNNLRGFRGERFGGNSSFYHNTDLRMDILYWKNKALPMGIGIVLFFDYGRVWDEMDTFSGLHYGYGGGLILSPVELTSFTLTSSWSDPRENDMFFEFKLRHYF